MIDLRHLNFVPGYCPIRLVGSDFYIPASSLEFTTSSKDITRNIRFQIATCAESTSFCSQTLLDLGLVDGQEVKILIDGTEVLLIAHRNELEGNILGRDVLYNFILACTHGQVKLTSSK
ncbi:hypothetical protein BH23THE1_BH23THE1_33870 [soil metagenome]